MSQVPPERREGRQLTAPRDPLPAEPTAARLHSYGGRLFPAPPEPRAVPLGSITFDRQRIDLVWLTRTDSILVDFADIEPKRIGTVVMREDGPGFVAQPGHLDWLGYDDRERRLLNAAVRVLSRGTAEAMRGRV
ncbi:hypothetical protein AB0B28_06340 [Glycomyces sp. NPDC046736]|uniref:hypothetical protein n=1 Tax=Glycomyces sp. NPDC046736 TaxID=3155615 RepID=UPI003402BEE2